MRDATSRGWPVLIHAGFGARPLAGPMAGAARGGPGARLVLAHGPAATPRHRGAPRRLAVGDVRHLARGAGRPGRASRPRASAFGSDRPVRGARHGPPSGRPRGARGGVVADDWPGSWGRTCAAGRPERPRRRPRWPPLSPRPRWRWSGATRWPAPSWPRRRGPPTGWPEPPMAAAGWPWAPWSAPRRRADAGAQGRPGPLRGGRDRDRAPRSWGGPRERASRRRLAELLAAAGPDLAEANLLIAERGLPGLDLAAALAAVDALAGEARSGAEGVSRPARAGFRGDVDDYDARATPSSTRCSSAGAACRSRSATLALAVAGRVGAPMAGRRACPATSCWPTAAGPSPAYIDPFNGWARARRGDCARLVAATRRHAVPPEYLARWPARDPRPGRCSTCAARYTRRRLDGGRALDRRARASIAAPGDAGLARRPSCSCPRPAATPRPRPPPTAFLADRPDRPGAPPSRRSADACATCRRRMN